MIIKKPQNKKEYFMRTFLKIAAVCLPFLTAAPSIAQLRWGVDLHFGSPQPRREIIIARPYPDAIWEPGYYNHFGRRYIWVPGRWCHPHYYVAPGHRYGWDQHKNWHNNWSGNRNWMGKDHDRDDRKFRRGRIR